MYGYLQLGQDRAAQQVLDEIMAIQQLDVENFAAAYAFAAIPSRYALERQRWAEAAQLTLHPSTLAWQRFPQAEAVLIFARGLGAARSGDIATARKDLDRAAGPAPYHARDQADLLGRQAEIQHRVVAAWLARAEGKNQEALDHMHAAADLEDATEKHPVTPGSLVPARELLGEMLIEFNDPGQALQAFEASHRVEPNRFKGLYGAARAAAAAGEREKAQALYTQLVTLAAKADGECPELVGPERF